MIPMKGYIYMNVSSLHLTKKFVFTEFEQNFLKPIKSKATNRSAQNLELHN